MTSAVHTIAPTASLSEAAQILWEHDLGALVVVDADGHLCGMLTDRDICMAAFTSGRALHQLVAANHMARTVFAVMPGDELSVAEKRMAMHQLRRLPVVSGEGRLVGMVCLADLVRSKVSGSRLKALMAKICAPRATRSEEPVKEVIPLSSKPAGSTPARKSALKPALKPARKRSVKARATKVR